MDRGSGCNTRNLAVALEHRLPERLHFVVAASPRQQQQAHSLLDQLAHSARQAGSWSRPGAPSTQPEGTRMDADGWLCVQAQTLLQMTGQQW